MLIVAAIIGGGIIVIMVVIVVAEMEYGCAWGFCGGAPAGQQAEGRECTGTTGV
jgi:hypothetical protein